MCSGGLVLGGLGAAGSLLSFGAQSNAAELQQAYQEAAAATKELNTIRQNNYEIEGYLDELDYAEDVLSWQEEQLQVDAERVQRQQQAVKSAFDRQERQNEINLEAGDRATDRAEQAFSEQLSSQFRRMVEEEIARSFYGEEVWNEARAAAAQTQVSTSARGFSGNSADVAKIRAEAAGGRQMGTVNANQRGSYTQRLTEAMSIGAQAANEVRDIKGRTAGSLGTYFGTINPTQMQAPSRLPQKPGPLPEQPVQAPIQKPSALPALINAGTSIAGGFQQHYSSRGQHMPDSFVDTLLLREGTPKNS